MYALLPSLSRLGLGLLTLAALAYLGAAAAERRPTSLGRAQSAVPLGAGALLLVLPWALAPPLLRAVAAALCLATSVLLCLVALRTFGRLRKAREEAAADLAGALARLEGDTPAEVVARGRLSGEPARRAPLTGRPCLRYQLEVSRGPPEGPFELVFFDEAVCERLVLRDGTALIALAAGSPLPRDCRLVSTDLEGTVDAPELLELPAPRRPIARLARQFDPDLPSTGSFCYRLCERIVPDAAPARASGRLERQQGEPTLVPATLRLEAEGEPARELATLLRLTRRHAAAAAGALLASGLWLLAG